MLKRMMAVLAACVLLHACGGGSRVADVPPTTDPGSPQSCTFGEQRASLAAWMQDRYYWNSALVEPDPAAPDINSYFDSMLAKPIDRYSFTQSTASYEQVFTSGWRIGFGYTLATDGSGTLRVRNLEPESPAASSGLQRGDTIVSIDGFTPAQVQAGALAAVDVPGVDRVFVVSDSAGTQRTITVRSALFGLNPVGVATTVDAMRGGQPVKVGYLAYHQFVAYSAWGLALAIQNMANQGVGELVLDLRYNGGGSVNTSRDLASFISGSLAQGAVYTHLHFNAQHPELDQDIRFMTADQRYAKPLDGLQRLIVITSRGTASASELLINGLRPYMPVVLIGDTTYGKPYGFMPRSDCGTTYNAVNFEAVNAAGVGGYSDGLPVDCPVADDFDHQLGDTQERRFAEALNYIATGRCSAQAPRSALLAAPAKPKAPPWFGETVPSQMFLD